MPDAYLDADEIRRASFIRHVEIHDTLGSTNDRAAELARDPQIELPALVATRLQTAGRGRGSNKWVSAEGALTFSVLLDPTKLGISAANWPRLSLATAVAVCDAISIELNITSERAGASPPPFGVADAPARSISKFHRLAIKWPNDVMLDGSKLCGILIESPGGAAPAKDRLIIGIGINVNNSWHDLPAARNLAQHGTKAANAIALCDVTGRAHALQQLLPEVLRALQTRITQLSLHDQQLPAAWKRLCWLTEQGVEVQSNGNSIAGVCLGIDNDGTLVVENVLGIHRIRSGSARIIASA
jgi:BirA family biotin operon repressor/biotin-[acetyl-CoA-carboxylase] ligase